MQQIRRPGASLDRHGASSCGWPGGRATVGWGARWTGARPPAGSCPTEITRPNPSTAHIRRVVRRHGMHAACPPTDHPSTSGSAPRHGRRSGASKATAVKSRVLRWRTR
jgi:hypothetical protein